MGVGTQTERFRVIWTMNTTEQERQFLQTTLDEKRSTEYRRRLGQFATPFSLASEITSYGISLLGDKGIRFLEPAIGTGSFLSALLSSDKEKNLQRAMGFEIDEEIGAATKELWGDQIDLVVGDFTKEKPVKGAANLLISNPPYVRHHFIDPKVKETLRNTIASTLGIKVSGLAGLYCYFILLAHDWLDDDAVSGWLIPSEFMDVNYGVALKSYLLDKVQLLRIHRYDSHSIQFDDALVSSAVVWFSKRTTSEDYEVEFTYGGTLDEPILSKRIKKSVLEAEHKWTRFPENGARESKSLDTRLKDMFTIKRGVATGDNGFFILDKSRIEQNGLRYDYLTPILPSPRNLGVTEILADSDGNPLIDNPLFLINCSLPEHQIREKYPELYEYLQNGLETVAGRYLCKSKRYWYQQEQRKPAPILCTYMGRGTRDTGRPFRFILNHSDAIATNSYLMLYPKEMHCMPSLYATTIESIWNELSNLSPNALTSEGRIYGGGLRKIEPKELGEVIYGSSFAPQQLQVFQTA